MSAFQCAAVIAMGAEAEFPPLYELAPAESLGELGLSHSGDPTETLAAVTHNTSRRHVGFFAGRGASAAAGDARNWID